MQFEQTHITVEVFESTVLLAARVFRHHPDAPFRLANTVPVDDAVLKSR